MFMGKRNPTLALTESRGFTLAELLVGCALFGILAAISVPRFIAFQPSLRLNGATRDVFAQLMWARARAVEENNRYIVSLPNNHSLSIVDDKNNNGTTDAGETITVIDIQLEYPDITLAKAVGDPDPVFLPRGTTQGATTIIVTNSAGSRTVSVNITGVVKIN
jgi:prepilin-type N-terminal cleavage/methylation domain-containing protein